jgi:hypothetical protein
MVHLGFEEGWDVGCLRKSSLKFGIPIFPVGLFASMMPRG